jgi:hypothetical protein
MWFSALSAWLCTSFQWIRWAFYTFLLLVLAVSIAERFDLVPHPRPTGIVASKKSRNMRPKKEKSPEEAAHFIGA